MKQAFFLFLHPMDSVVFFRAGSATGTRYMTSRFVRKKGYVTNIGLPDYWRRAEMRKRRGKRAHTRKISEGEALRLVPNIQSKNVPLWN